jgi:hypothetical protein
MNEAKTKGTTTEPVTPSAAAVGSTDLVSHRRTIELGALCPKLSKQLAGLKLSQGVLDLLDKLADSLTWCHLHGLLTDSEHNRAGQRLIARVRKEVRKVANAAGEPRPPRDNH